MDKEPTRYEQLKRERDQRVSGMEEGFSQGVWAMIALAIVLFGLYQLIPA